MVPALCAEYRLIVTDLGSGNIEEFPVSDKVSTVWSRYENEYPELSVIVAGLNCVDVELVPYVHRVEWHRSGERVAAGIVEDVIPQSSSDSVTYKLVTESELYMRHVHEEAISLDGKAIDLVSRMLNQVDSTYALGLQREPIPNGLDASVEWAQHELFSKSLDTLSSYLEWTQYADSQGFAVFRYGDLDYDTAAFLTEDHWEKQNTPAGLFGSNLATVVYAGSSLSDVEDVVVWPPENQERPDHGVFRPVRITVPEATHADTLLVAAQREWERRQSALVINVDGESKVTKKFPLDIATLLPGAIATSQVSVLNRERLDVPTRVTKIEVQTLGKAETAVSVTLVGGQA